MSMTARIADLENRVWDFDRVNDAMTEYANAHNLCWLNYCMRTLGGGFDFVSALIPVPTLEEFSIIQTDPSKLLVRAVAHSFGVDTLDARCNLAYLLRVKI